MADGLPRSIYDPDTGPPQRPAACVVLRRGDGSLLLVRRGDTLSFMPGHHVFPGGRVDPEDALVPVDNAPDPEDARHIAAAARELFEEAGVLPAACAPPPPGQLRRMRADLTAGRLGFAVMLAQLGARIDAAQFRPAGRWITPVFMPVRYDTRHYLVEDRGWPRDPTPPDPGGETAAADWMTPGEALRRWRAGRVKMATPTAFTLRSMDRLPPGDALARMLRVPGTDDAAAFMEPRAGIVIMPLRTETLPPATHTNCAVVGWDDLCVVDPGPSDPEERARLVARLDDFVALGGRVAAVALSHGHRDHADAARLIRDRYGAAVWAHPAAALPDGLRADRLMADGEAVELGGDPPWRLRALHTPGHDPGHLCFFEEGGSTLFCGDLFANPGTIVVSPEHGGDMTAYLASLERVAAVDAGMIVPGHGMNMTGPVARERLLWLIRHRMERERRILEAWEAGARTVAELTARAYADTPGAPARLAGMQVRAHLARLGLTPEDGAL